MIIVIQRLFCHTLPLRTVAGKGREVEEMVEVGKTVGYEFSAILASTMDKSECDKISQTRTDLRGKSD